MQATCFHTFKCAIVHILLQSVMWAVFIATVCTIQQLRSGRHHMQLHVLSRAQIQGCVHIKCEQGTDRTAETALQLP